MFVFVVLGVVMRLAGLSIVRFLAYLREELTILTSKGAHGVPGSAIVILAATLNAVPSIPAIGLVLVLSVDWFIGMARALGNLIGNCVATVVIAAWEKDLDHAKAKEALYGRFTVDVTAG